MSAAYQCPGCGHNEAQKVSHLQDLQCGLTTHEGAYKPQDDLVGLFNRNMSLQVKENTVNSQHNFNGSEGMSSTLGYSSSQHYYPPPAHLASRNMTQLPGDDFDINQALGEHGINASHLLSSQISLFRQAAPEQRERLIELWRISPIDQARSDGLGGWKETSLEQEEELARIRFERRACEGLSKNSNLLVIPEDTNTDFTSGNTSSSNSVEPYMKSGYEILAERDYNEQRSPSVKTYQHAFDPAFSGKEWWKDFVTKQPMEFQYGMFDQMNRFRPVSEGLEQEDEEML